MSMAPVVSRRRGFLSRSLVACLAAVAAISGCAHLSNFASRKSDPPSQVRPPLTHEDAQSRSKQIGQIRYALWFAVNGSYPDFEGRTVVQFTWRGPKSSDGKPLFLDFTDGKIGSLKINNTVLSAEEVKRLYSGYRLNLPQEHLNTGLNRIEVAYSHDYNQDGVGIHRFQDPADGKVYLYSNSEPYDANQIFPCFDQPDLKATYELTVEAPADWAVISNMGERDVTTFDGRASWSFPATPFFSTYLFALHAGPYELWKSDYNGVPLRLFARESLKTYVDAKEWFDVTKAGLEFYSTYFEYPYPFVKYDQVLVPEFNSGAMENIAAVTFSDNAIFRSRPTQAQLRSRADTILHEMAHMWFGNLVTMKWWNGLWLNESFATYASNRALESLAKDHPSLRRIEWARTYSANPGQELFGEKEWAYWSDQSTTTHPIEVPVRNTDEAESNFDGITYSKGAGVLKQLAFLLGEEDFQEGLRRYFRRYAYKNTTQLQFIKTLQEASEKPLESWLQEWIESEGTNTVEAQFSCGEDGKVARFDLVQGNAPRSKRLRTHQTQLALHDRDSRVQSVIHIGYSGERTNVQEAIGKPCPAWVNPNHGDFDYVQVKLDPVTRAFLLNSGSRKSPLSGAAPLLAREQLWQALWQSTLEGVTPAAEFAKIFFEAGIHETDPNLLRRLLHRIYSTTALDPSVSLWISPQERLDLARRLHAWARKQVLTSPAGSDRQRHWWNLALQSAPEADDSAWISSALAGKVRIPGMPLDQDHRWELLESWARIPSRDILQFGAALAAETNRDRSESGRKWLISIRAATASLEAKQQAFDLARSRDTSFSELREIAGAFSWTGQDSLHPWLEDRYFAELPKIIAEKSNEEAGTFASGFFPFSCGGKALQRLEMFMASRQELPASVMKSLQSIREEEERCSKLRRAAPAPSSKLGPGGVPYET
jgi:aminopeptidase N